MKIIDQREMQKNKQKKQQRQRGIKGTEAVMVKDKWFCWAFKLGFHFKV